MQVEPYSGWELARVVVGAASSALVLWAALVADYDMRHVRAALTDWRSRCCYSWLLSLFLGLVAFGEGLALFGYVTGTARPPAVSTTLTDTAWALLAGLLLILRPLSHRAYLCPYQATCPARAAARAALPLVRDAAATRGRKWPS